MAEPVAGHEGTVIAQLPRALYRVRLDSGHQVVAHLVAASRRNFVRILTGDRVLVEVSPVDRTKGRIQRRLGGQ